MARRVTIQDVADRAGVGKVTVSYVLNGKDEEARISPATAERIRAAAIELNYRPSAVGRMLARSQADAVAMVFQYGDYFGAQTAFISEVMRCVCKACVENQVDVVLHTKLASDPLTEANNFTDGRVDGVLMIRDAEDATYLELVARDFPTVLFFCRSDQPNAHYIACDNQRGGRMATEHLIHLGHTRIGMIRGGMGSVDSNDRLVGYQAALNTSGINFDPELVVEYHGADGHSEDFLALMQRPDRPTGLVVWSDDAAFECIRLCNGIGLNVPGDVSLIGFDSTHACERSNPPLTSIRQPIELICAEAVRLLLALRKSPVDATLCRQIFPPILDVRQSTGHPPKNSSTMRSSTK
ncbi:MAG: LacI family transcriptional regulator [Armatimonadetes bacterium]|nr:LacI family transcriptional regulator [Armatimonadota bacterium]